MTVKAVATRGCPVVQTRRAETSARSTQLRRGGPALTARRKLARDAQRVESAYSLTTSRRGDRSARTVAPRAAGEVQIQVDKPLGLTLGKAKSKTGGPIVKSVKGSAAAAGLKRGDEVIYVSSFFGDELWPADNLRFVQTALNAAPSPVTLIVNRGGKAVNIKRLPKRPAPKRFGRKMTTAQASVSHICIDCGYIYTKSNFADLPKSYRCPQCNSPKRRFKPYDGGDGKSGGGGAGAGGIIAIVVALAVIAGAAFYVSTSDF